MQEYVQRIVPKQHNQHQIYEQFDPTLRNIYQVSTLINKYHERFRQRHEYNAISGTQNKRKLLEIVIPSGVPSTLLKTTLGFGFARVC